VAGSSIKTNNLMLEYIPCSQRSCGQGLHGHIVRIPYGASIVVVVVVAVIIAAAIVVVVVASIGG